MSTPQNSKFATFLRDQSGRRGQRAPVSIQVTPATSRGKATKRGQGRQAQASQSTTSLTLPAETFHTPVTETSAEVYYQENNSSANSSPERQDLSPEIIQPAEEDQVAVVLEPQIMATPGPQMKLPNFSGTPGEKGKAWFQRFRHMCKNMFHYNEAKVKATFSFFLTGQALAWYNSLPEETREDPDAALALFMERFDGSDGGFALGSIKQRATEDINDYFTRFLELTNDQGMPDTWLVATFVDGLVAPVRKIVKPQELASLEAARKAAMRAEQVISDTVEVSAIQRQHSDGKMDQLLDLVGKLCFKLDNQTQTVYQNPGYNNDIPRGPHQPVQHQQMQGQTWSQKHYHKNHQQTPNQHNSEGRNSFNFSSGEPQKFCENCNHPNQHTVYAPKPHFQSHNKKQ